MDRKQGGGMHVQHIDKNMHLIILADIVRCSFDYDARISTDIYYCIEHDRMQ